MTFCVKLGSKRCSGFFASELLVAIAIVQSSYSARIQRNAKEKGGVYKWDLDNVPIQRGDVGLWSIREEDSEMKDSIADHGTHLYM